jgi:hypothetical protein
MFHRRQRHLFIRDGRHFDPTVPMEIAAAGSLHEPIFGQFVDIGCRACDLDKRGRLFAFAHKTLPFLFLTQLGPESFCAQLLRLPKGHEAALGPRDLFELFG